MAARARDAIVPLKPIEAVRREERLVDHLEGYARLDERVVHAEHVIRGTVALRDPLMQ